MKASIKFRDEQKPLLRAKIPLSILTLPFQSGVVAGESKELSLNLGTLFDSGPSFKVSYRPNDSLNPFSFVFKTGIGHFGSPVNSPFTMSAEFNLIGNQNPKFLVHFKPQFGDFSLKKSHSSSVITETLSSKSNGIAKTQDGFETPVVKAGYFHDHAAFLGGKVGVMQAESAVTSAVENLFSGTVVSARTAFPLKNRAVVNFRWGLRFPELAPAEEPDTVVLGKHDFTSGISFKHCPMLVMNKIGIEHVSKDSKDAKSLTSPGNADVAEACVNVKKQLGVIQVENGLLRNALSDLRSELAAGRFNFSPNGLDGAERSGSKFSYGGGRGDRRGNSDKKSSESGGFNGKVMEEDVSEELKKKKAFATGA